MARKKVSIISCDRCGRTIDESPGAEEEEVFEDDDSKPLLYLEQKGHPPVTFDDLCKKCDKRVGDLCGQIRKEPAPKKEAATDEGKTAAAPAEKKPAETKPPKKETKKKGETKAAPAAPAN